MSKVFIFGANGKVGKILVNTLNNTNEFDVTARLKYEQQFAIFKDGCFLKDCFENIS